MSAKIREPNRRLAEVMAVAGMSNKGLAKRICDATAGTNNPVRADHNDVRKWLAGMAPKDPKPQIIAHVLSQSLGRKLSLSDLGFGGGAEIPADLGLRYPSDLEEGIGTASRLWQADIEGVQSLLAAPAYPGAWNEAALSWLVRSASGSSDTSQGRRVGLSDVTGIRATTEMFDRLDGQRGGGHARTALIEFLRQDVAPVLRGSYSGEVGRELFRAAASATMLAAWMSYDAGVHGIAQRYFVLALKFAESGEDPLLAASILDAMSHQATFLGDYREAANLARAALAGTTSVASPALAAHFHVMEARALARVGDATACDSAMASAVREFERRQPGAEPEWFSYFDDAELAAELGHCNRDLGRSVDATTYATQSVGANGEQVRSDFFVTMVLADSYLDQGDAEQACQVALKALEIGEQLKSARCAAYVHEFRQRLAPLAGSLAVRDFTEQARTARLWTPAEARRGPSHAG